MEQAEKEIKREMLIVRSRADTVRRSIRRGP